jgi:hypothetical protein
MAQRRKKNGQFAKSLKGKTSPKAEFRPTANPAYAEGMRMIRQSNAAGTHEDRRTRRARTRGDALRKTLGEQE